MKLPTPSKTAAAVIAATASLPLGAFAETLELVASGDGFIRASQNASQTNNDDNVLFLLGNTSPTDEMRGFLQFDLSDPALTGATINSVSLTLTIDGSDANSVDGIDTLSLFQITESFSESAATWTSRDGTNNWTTAGGTFSSPALTSTTADAGSAAAGDEVIFSGGTLDAAVSNTIGSSIGLLIKLDTIDSDRSIFRFVANNSFAAKIDLRPTLTIDYTAVPEPSTLALIAGLTGLTFVIARRRK